MKKTLASLVDSVLLFVASIYAAETYIHDAGPNGVFMTSLAGAQKRAANSGLWAFIAEAIDCTKCLSMWLSLMLLVLRAVSRPAYLLVSVPLTVSAAADFVQGMRERP